jgi:hypothetical protein
LAEQYAGESARESLAVAPSKQNSPEAGAIDHKIISCRFPCPSPESIDDLLSRLQEILDAPPDNPEAAGGEYGIKVKLIAECRDGMTGHVGRGTTAMGNEPTQPPTWMTGPQP